MRKAIVLSASFLLAFNACKKDGELVPDFEENTTFSFFYDSTKIETSTRIGDSVLADKVSIGLVGTYQDSAFGKSISSIYVQPLLPTNALVFKEDDEMLNVDSIILSLEYADHYGDTSISQTLEAFRLTETLDFEENYFSDTSIQVESTPIGSINFFPTPNSQITISQPNNIGNLDTVTVASQLRIPLNISLAEEIISKQGSSELANNTNFLSFFQGIKLTPQAGTMVMDNQAAILYLRLTATNTKMTIYYTTTDSQNNVKKKAVDFPINTSSVRFNTFEHDYTGSAVETVLQNPNMTSLFAYTEAMAGVETNIKFTSIKDELPSNVIINKAELFIPAANGSYADSVGKAKTIIVASRKEDGTLQFIPDAFENTDYFGGTWIESENAYRFNIARYIQSYLNGGENDKGLTVLVTGSAVKAERAVFLTENNPNTRIKLNLYYTNTQ
ncbi:MAG: DUF4270 family protein [Flavobacteriales bacterium]|nr:DUF4270 family protein [Flavobacteriales bacterium]